ncbi:MAG: LysE family transporter [Armatimonadota bacterium]|nr:LysE family transporter [Armatimonadota bacterium]
MYVLQWSIMMDLLPLTLVFGSSLAIALTGALMPGPVLTVTLAGVVARGFAAAPRVVLGHALLELAVVAGVFFGVAEALRSAGVWELAQGVTGTAGGLALLWMGLGILREVRQGRASLDLASNGASAAGGALRDVGAGALASASNPYWVFWWLTIGAGYALAALRHGPAGLAAFYLGHISGDLAWYTFVGGLVAAGRRAVNQRVYRGFLFACSMFLLLFASLFLVYGVRLLMRG